MGGPLPFDEDPYGRSARYRELPPHRMPQYEDEVIGKVSSGPENNYNVAFKFIRYIFRDVFVQHEKLLYKELNRLAVVMNGTIHGCVQNHLVEINVHVVIDEVIAVIHPTVVLGKINIYN